MKVYHGTSLNCLPSILKNGIIPRGDDESNWPDNVSHPEMIYLTIAYPFYFAHIAAQEHKSKPVVIEIDMDFLSERNLFPDEDFIFQGLPKDQKMELSDIRENIDCFQQYFQASIDNLSNFCYRGIVPIESITRTCQVNFGSRSFLWMEVMDPTITIMNYRFVGQKYRDLIAWFFGDKKELPGVARSKEFLKSIPDNKKEMEKALKLWKKESKNRDGIEVKNIKAPVVQLAETQHLKC